MSTLPDARGQAPTTPFHLAVLTNEISEDLARALAVAADLGIGVVELNSLWGKPVTDVSPEEVRQARELLQAAGMRVSVITDPAFKAATLDAIAAPGAGETESYRRHRQVLERAIALAHEFGTDRVRLFAFRRPAAHGAIGPGWQAPPAPTAAELEAISRGLRPLCALAADEGVTLLLENVRFSYADTSANSLAILRAVDSPHLGLIWDPANAFVSGDPAPAPEGYAAVRRFVRQVHVKDARFLDHARGETVWEKIGQGEVDLGGQLSALCDDGYRGGVTIETHWRLPGDSAERSTVETWRGLRALIDRTCGGAVAPTTLAGGAP